MGLFSRWRVAHKHFEDERWRVMKKRYIFKPSLSELEDEFGGGYFKLQKVSGLGDIITTIEYESDAEFKETNSKKKKRRYERIEVPVGSGQDRTKLVLPETMLEDPKKLEGIATLLRMSRLPSQDVIDFGEKIGIVSSTFGGDLGEVLLDIVSAIGGMRRNERPVRNDVANVERTNSLNGIEVSDDGISIGQEKKKRVVKEEVFDGGDEHE